MKKKGRSLIALGIVVTVLLLTVLFCLLSHFDFLNIIKNGFFDSEVPPDKTPDNTTPERKTLTYQISEFNVDITSYLASVKVDVAESCLIRIRLVDEEAYFSDSEPEVRYLDGLIGEAEILISEGLDNSDVYDYLSVQTVDIEVPLEGTFPPYFVAEAQLFNEQGDPLSDPIYNIKSSKRYEQFLAITPADFSESDNIVNFDTNSTLGTNDQIIQNFGVLADCVKVITAASVSHPKYWDNSYHENIYEIVSPSAEIQRGDYVYVTDGVSAEVFCVWDAWNDEKSENIVYVYPLYPQVSHTTDEISTYDLMHFYKFIRSDMSLVCQDTDTKEVSLLSYTEIPIDEKKKLKDIHIKGLEYDDGAVSVDADLENIEVGAKGYLIYAPQLFGDDYFECEIRSTIKLNLSADFSASASADSAKESKLKVNFPKLIPIKIPTPLAGLMLTAEFDMGVSGEMSGTLSIDDIPLYGKVGFRYATTEGFKSLGRSGGIIGGGDGKDYVTCEGNASVRFGPNVTFGVEYIHGLLVFNADISAGLSIYALTDGEANYDRNESGLIHQCELCIDGKVYFDYDISLSFGSKIGILARMAKGDDLEKESKLDKVGWYPLQITVLKVSIDLGDFYVSAINDEGHPKFGIGDCQNYILRLPISQKCSIYEELSCQATYSDIDPELLLKQEEAGYFDNYHSSDRVWKQKEEADKGRHNHIGESFTITVTDNETGHVLFTKEVVMKYDSEGHLIEQEDLYAEIPLSCQKFHVEVECVCKVLECKMTLWYPNYPVGSQERDDHFYPVRTVEHTVEYNITHNAEVVRGTSTYGSVTEQQENLLLSFSDESEIHGPFGSASTYNMGWLFNWDYNNRIMGHYYQH